MISFSMNGIRMSISLDWLGVGFSGLAKHGKKEASMGPEILSAIEAELGEAKPCKNSFYSSAYKGDGWSFFFDRKEGVKNAPYALEMRGSLFTGGVREESVNNILSLFYDGGAQCNPYRIDARLDIFSPIDEEISFQSSYMTGKYFYTENKVCSGFSVGKGDTVFRFYDKKLQQEEAGNKVSFPHWWRWEVQIRGDVLKSQFSQIPGEFYYSDFLAVGSLMLSSRNKVDIKPTWIQTCSGHVVSGDIVKLIKKKGSFEGSMIWFEKEMERRTKQFYNSLLRKYPELVVVAGLQPTNKESEWYDRSRIWDDDE